MKVAVVTNFDTGNYGSVLQAFALQIVLKGLLMNEGTCCVLLKQFQKKKTFLERVINKFKPSRNHYTLWDKYQMRKSRSYYVAKLSNIKLFVQNNLSVVGCKSIAEAEILSQKYDVIIAGSDQIWSPSAGQLSDFTLLNFVYKHTTSCFSYAASIGVEALNSEEKEKLKTGLAKFQVISLRESSSVSLVSDYCKLIRWDIDPSLLLLAEDWHRIASPKYQGKEFIFVYMLRPEPLTLKIAQALSVKHDLPIYICSNRIINESGVNNITDAGVEDFLSLIANSRYVVTNSFHGTAFAVNLNKPFISIAIEGSGMRVRDFLKCVNLEMRIASAEKDSAIIEEDIDWQTVNDRLNSLRNYSLSYLSSIVKKQKDDNNSEQI